MTAQSIAVSFVTGFVWGCGFWLAARVLAALLGAVHLAG